MFLTGLATATPPFCFTQQQCWAALQESEQVKWLDPRSRALLKKILRGNNGIQQRHFALQDLKDAFRIDPDTLHARFLSAAPRLASEAASRALEKSGLRADQVDALIISTCTGYLCPGLTSYAAERLGFRKDLICVDLVGQGCGAAIPNARTAEAMILSGRCEHVISICVEVCSAAVYIDNDPGVIVSAALFGDGAAAAVWSKQPSAKRRVEWLWSESLLEPEHRDQLQFESRGGMLRNILRPTVPALTGDAALRLFKSGARANQLEAPDIRQWIWHAGGRDIFTSIEQRLGLQESDTRWSRDILATCGNVSSPSVFFVLNHALSSGAAGGYWWAGTFGAGFSAHAALLRVD